MQEARHHAEHSNHHGSRTADMRHRTRPLTLTAAFLATALTATTLFVAAAPALAHTIERFGYDHGSTKAETVTKDYPWFIRGQWKERGHNCRPWPLPCRGNFYTTSRAGDRATWHMGDMQGVYKFSRTLPDHFDRDKTPATGRVEWTVWEKRAGSSDWRKVHIYSPGSQRNRLGWYTYNNPEYFVELDGEVKITAKSRDHRLVGVQKVRLTHVGVLPEHEISVQIICITYNMGLDKMVSDFLSGHALESPLLGDEVAPLQELILETGMSEEDRVSTIKGLAQEVLFRAAVRILSEIYDSGAEGRVDRIVKQCKKYGGGWHFNGRLGWTYYQGWGHAAKILADKLHWGWMFKSECFTIVMSGGLETGCLYVMRRS